MDKFWMVMRLEDETVQSMTSAPRYKHYTAESAKAEAERLARTYPGNQFVILEAKAAACYQAVTWTPASDEPQEIPF